MGYVQISPPMQKSVQGTQWWTVYQPISYDLNSRFGTREELSNMIKTCAANNVGAIADVVLNHTTGSDVSWVDDQEGVAGTKYNGTRWSLPWRWACLTLPKAATTTSTAIRPAISMIAPKRSSARLTRTPTKLQNCRLSSMWDINTGSERVQDIQAAYLADLWNLERCRIPYRFGEAYEHEGHRRHQKGVVPEDQRSRR